VLAGILISDCSEEEAVKKTFDFGDEYLFENYWGSVWGPLINFSWY
jgi:hypothetical protein